jgi:predicted transposase YdaD
MEGYEYQSEFARKYYNHGRSEGREEGRSEGLRAGVIALAHVRLEAVTPDDQAAIAAIEGDQALLELLRALGQAGGPAEARAAFEAAVRGGSSR